MRRTDGVVIDDGHAGEATTADDMAKSGTPND